MSDPAKTLDVVILAEALNNTVDKFGWIRSTPSDPVGEWLVNAQRVADEYARLAANQSPNQSRTSREAPDEPGR